MAHHSKTQRHHQPTRSKQPAASDPPPAPAENATPAGKATPRQRPHTFRVLLVGVNEKLSRTIARSGISPQARLRVDRVPDRQQARQHLARRPADLVILKTRLPDGCGLELAEHLAQRKRRIDVVVLSDQPSLEQSVRAMRAGAWDYLAKPVDTTQLQDAVRRVVDARLYDRDQARRVRRLRRACRKLDEAREQVSEQVDLLCSDLVAAYQELAEQMQQSARSHEYAQRVENELDLEALLRTTLNYLLEQTGPTHGAVFLPANMSDFTIGGFVNEDGAGEPPALAVEQLADVLAPQLAGSDQAVIHLRDRAQVEQWAGDQISPLHGMEVVALSCRDEDETLAVIVLFRDRQRPFDPQIQELCHSMAPVLRDALLRLIRVHHRHLS